LEKNNGVITKLKFKNAELKARVAKLKKNYRLKQNDSKGNNAHIVTNSFNISSSNFNSNTSLPKELITEKMPQKLSENIDLGLLKSLYSDSVIYNQKKVTE
ncbi:5137_t:CDS:2, partial [Funneliformis geosporum]